MKTSSLALAAALLAALAGCTHHVTCPGGETECGGRCVDLLTDLDNCGSCGNAATTLEVCRAGARACAPGVATCDGACTDLARDATSCGACGTTCDADAYCTTVGGSTSCEVTAPEGYQACGRAYVDPLTDRLNCGTCGNACTSGQTCRAGLCGADVVVACYASGDVRAVTTDLAPAGAARLAGGSPTTLALLGSSVYSGNAYDSGVTVFPLDDRLPSRTLLVAGDDIEGLTPYAGTVLVANAGTNALTIVDPTKSCTGLGCGVLDELALPGTAPNPHGVAVVGTTAYVSLYGDGPNGFGGHAETTGQALAKVDLSSLAACAAGTAAHCGTVADAVLDLTKVAGAFDEGGYPFPSKLAVRGSKLYVTLANLKLADCGFGSGYCQPAGNGKLAVVDTADGDAVSIVDLTSACRNPGAISISGDQAWVACGSFTFSTEAPGAVVQVDLSGAAPVVVAAVDASSIVPGGLAVCGDHGYVADQGSGGVLRFTTADAVAEAPVEVCPQVSSGGYSWAWAADVACSAP
jgi:hypothetical protein